MCASHWGLEGLESCLQGHLGAQYFGLTLVPLTVGTYARPHGHFGRLPKTVESQ